MKGSRWRAQGVEFEIWSARFRVQGCEDGGPVVKGKSTGPRVEGLGCRVGAAGQKVQGPWSTV